MLGFYVRILCSDFMFGFYVRILCPDFMFGIYVRIFLQHVRILCSEFMFIFYVLFRVGFMFRSLAGMTRILAVYPILQGVGLVLLPPAPSKSPPLKRQGMGAPDWVYVLHLLAMSAGRGYTRYIEIGHAQRVKHVCEMLLSLPVTRHTVLH